MTYVSFLYSSVNLRDIQFGHPDSSSTKICGCNSSTCDNNDLKLVTGNLVGMAVKNSFNSVNVNSGNELSIWDDVGDSQCSQPVTSIIWVTKISN